MRRLISQFIRDEQGQDVVEYSLFLVLIGANVAISIPATPGGVGMLEAGAMLVLAAYGVDPAKALAFALFYHGIHLIPPTIAGAIVVQMEPLASGLRAARAEVATPSEPVA